jgi:hypothetical protein
MGGSCGPHNSKELFLDIFSISRRRYVITENESEVHEELKSAKSIFLHSSAPVSASLDSDVDRVTVAARPAFPDVARQIVHLSP